MFFDIIAHEAFFLLEEFKDHHFFVSAFGVNDSFGNSGQGFRGGQGGSDNQAKGEVLVHFGFQSDFEANTHIWKSSFSADEGVGISFAFIDGLGGSDFSDHHQIALQDINLDSEAEEHIFERT